MNWARVTGFQEMGSTTRGAVDSNGMKWKSARGHS